MLILLVVAVTGGVGSVLRLLTDTVVKSRVKSTFPWGTAIINISGTFVLAVLAGLLLRAAISPDLYAVAGIGLCGGYTTFSTASVETVRMIQSGRIAHAAVYSVGGIAITVLTSGAGFALASL